MVRLWDPYRVLNILPRDSDTMFCTGIAVSRGNARCRWKIPSGDRETIRSMLNAMETKPPNETLDMLPVLARLSLCEERHKGNLMQREDVVGVWEAAIADAGKEYDRVKKWIRRSKALEIELAKQTEERERLDVLLEERKKETWDCEEVRRQVEELKTAALEQCRVHEMGISEAGEERAVLSLKLANTRRSFERQARESEQMKVSIAEMSYQLTEEQKASEGHKADADINRAAVEEKSKLIDSLQSDLMRERQVLMQRQEELETVTNDKRSLSVRITEQQSELAAANEVLEKTKGQLEEALVSRKALTQELERLLSEISTEQQTSYKFKHNLQEVETHNSTLSRDQEKISSQLALVHQEKERLAREIRETKAREENLKAELKDVQAGLERTQLEVAQMLQTNEQMAAADAREIASAAERPRMLHRIRELEEEASAGCLSNIRAKFKNRGVSSRS